ncbi:exonuclease SbcC [Babesia caballi]|uniref:Exonuclease SbcC n=1 Tax=Babesia caballi TaxID=5871 RepID=A0AAV4LQB4_BABCB|nr:exonuclease SbcC [Babesia caballi]
MNSSLATRQVMFVNKQGANMDLSNSLKELCATRSYPSENELSGGHHAGSTSEWSSSTCDTSGSLPRGGKSRSMVARVSPLHSLKRPLRPKTPRPSEVRNAGIICPNCDAMRMQLTEANTQCYDKWISRIKILEDMLQEKQKINDDLQEAWYEQNRLYDESQHVNKALKKDLAAHAEAISDLKNENYRLSDAVRQKDEDIEELCNENKVLRARTEHGEKLRQLDMQTIERLRQMLADRNNDDASTTSTSRNRKVKAARTAMSSRIRRHRRTAYRIKAATVQSKRVKPLPKRGRVCGKAGKENVDSGGGPIAIETIDEWAEALFATRAAAVSETGGIRARNKADVALA